LVKGINGFPTMPGKKQSYFGGFYPFLNILPVSQASSTMRNIYFGALLCLFFSNTLVAQTMMPLPAHSTVYSTYARGYWFTAPVNFTITGLRVPLIAGTGAQYIHVMKCNDPFPVATSGSTNFTTLTYISGAPNGVIQNVSINVNAGDVIGILGTAFQSNSYSASAIHTSDIGGNTVYLTRFGYQGDIDAGPAPEYWGEAANTAGQIGLIEMYYYTGPCTSPPTPGTATSNVSTVCPGAAIQLNMTGGSGGSGQTYVWESGPSFSGPYTAVSTSSASTAFTYYPTSNEFLRLAITCSGNTSYATPVQITMGQSLGGTATTSAATVCSGSSAQLNLTGHTTYPSQTYTWESSTSSTGPFTPISTALSAPAFTINPTTDLYYRAAVNCGTYVDYSIPVQVTIGTAVAGTATSSVASVCAGNQVQLNLTGNTAISGQTYTWESATSLSGPWTPISSASASPAYTTTPVASLFYRAAVACGVTSYSTEVQVPFGSPLTGTYTINALQPASATNFTSISNALAQLACGLNGPVTLDIVAGSGPYNEQVIIPAISNASATNTVTINGNGNTIQYTPLSGARYIIRFNGADYVTINNLTLVSQSATYGWGFHFMNGADHNTISNCTVNLNATTATGSTNSACIVGSNSSTSGISDGNNGNYNLFTGNTFLGGYRTVSWVGNAGGLNAAGNVFTNNTFQDFYADGFYLENQDGGMISFNDIKRPTRASVTSGAGMEIGPGCRNMLINGNKIHDTHTIALTGTFYGIYLNDADAPVGMENRITNNLVYKLNSTTATLYGMYNASSDGAYYFHNTIALDYASSTSGTTRGFFQNTVATNIRFQNNIISVTRGGTGVKYCIYIGAASTIISNNNDLYMAAPAGTNSIGYYTAAQATLANWQAVNSNAWDQQSVSINPMFASTPTGDYTPTNALLNNLGTPVGINTDISNNPRSPSVPDMGSYEFLSSPLSPTLLNFTAARNNEDVILKWMISSGENIEKYFVERSSDGKSFEAIGQVYASSISLYSYLDKDAFIAGSEKFFYRLRILGKNGNVEFSRVVVVNFSNELNLLGTYPNPFKDRLTVDVTAKDAGTCIIKLKDIYGKTVVSESADLNKGNNFLVLDKLDHLSAGVYQLVMEYNGIVVNRKLVK
jgi:hypothetical protein